MPCPVRGPVSTLPSPVWSGVGPLRRTSDALIPLSAHRFSGDHPGFLRQSMGRLKPVQGLHIKTIHYVKLHEYFIADIFQKLKRNSGPSGAPAKRTSPFSREAKGANSFGSHWGGWPRQDHLLRAISSLTSASLMSPVGCWPTDDWNCLMAATVLAPITPSGRPTSKPFLFSMAWI